MVARGSEVRPSAVRHSAPGAGGAGGGAGRLAGLGLGGAALLVLLTGCDVGKTFGGFGWPQGGITPQSHRMYDLWIASVHRRARGRRLRLGPDLLVRDPLPQARRRAAGADPLQHADGVPLHHRADPDRLRALLLHRGRADRREQASRRTRTSPSRSSRSSGTGSSTTATARAATRNTVASMLGTSEVIPVLVLPTGRSIRFEETSRDVIHSFWVPELLFKRDVFPGKHPQRLRGLQHRPGGRVRRPLRRAVRHATTPS